MASDGDRELMAVIQIMLVWPAKIIWFFSKLTFYVGRHLFRVGVAHSEALRDEQARMRERERNSEEVRLFYDQLKKAGDRQLTEQDLMHRMEAVVERFDVSRGGIEPPPAIFEGFTLLAWVYYQDETFYVLDEPQYDEPVGEAEYLDYLREKKEVFDKIDEINTLFVDTLCVAYLNFVSGLPDAAFVTGDSALRVELLDTLDDPLESGRDIAPAFFTERCKEFRILEKVRTQFEENEEDAERRYHTRRQHVEALFKETGIGEMLKTLIPFEVPLEKQLEHSMIAAGSRYGKSQLIGALIATHLQSPDPPGIIVLDSTGDFAEKLSQLEVFHPERGSLRGRLLVVDPDDSPQLNMFDIENVRKRGYGSSDLEQIEADITNLFNYVFASIGGEFSSQQGAGFTFLVRLLLIIPNANINTMRDILELRTKSFDDTPQHIKAAVAKLDPTSQAYFKNQFFTLNMQSTREAVARRLYLILQNKTFERMFMGRNRVDFFEAMQEGKIIVINTNNTLLQAQASALFGRYIIARVMSAAFERATIRDINKRRPCIMFVDEAQEYFDSAIDTLLTQIGKYRLGLCIAFQYFAQLDDKLRTSVLGNTTVKYAGGLSAAEARLIARELRTDEEFVLAQRKDGGKKPRWARFATHIKYQTDGAISVQVPFYSLENMPKLSLAEHRLLRDANREIVCPRDPTPASPSPSPEAAAPEDVIVLPDLSTSESAPQSDAPLPPPAPKPVKPKVKLITKKSPPPKPDDDSASEWS